MKPTTTWIEHLKLREGFRKQVYLDSLGKPTVGYGHLVLPEDNLKLWDEISEEKAEEFLRQDSLKAWDAAIEQALLTGRCDLPFIEALASVNYQLGTGWYKVHKKTWKLIMQWRWYEAAQEAANSMWYRQTPTRVKDFQKALIEGIGRWISPT